MTTPDSVTFQLDVNNLPLDHDRFAIARVERFLAVNRAERNLSTTARAMSAR